MKEEQTRTVRRGRIFPEIQWTEEQKAQKRAEREAFYQRCKRFLIKSNRNLSKLITTGMLLLNQTVETILSIKI